MKRLRIGAVFAVASLAAFAGTCTITHISLTKIGSHDTFAGQLDNDSGANILQHNFVVAFLDANNNVVEVKTVPGCLRSLQNGATDYFSAASSASSSVTTTGLVRLAFDSSFKVGTAADGDLTISNLNVRREGTSLRVSGSVKNNDADTLVDGTACIVLFNSDDNVIITARVDLVDDSLTDNQTTTFDKSIVVPDDSDTVDHVIVAVDGLDGASDAAPINPIISNSQSISICATSTATSTPVTMTATATNTPEPTITPTLTNTPVATHTPCP